MTSETSDYVQFPGETPWDAIVNHNSLDIEEEDDFAAYCAGHGADQESDEYTLRRLYVEWREVTP